MRYPFDRVTSEVIIVADDMMCCCRQMMLVQAGVNTSTNQSSVEVEMVDRGSVDEGYVSGDSDSQSEYDYEWMESNVEKDDTEG